MALPPLTHILREDPELAGELSSAERAEAEAQCVARTLEVPPRDWRTAEAKLEGGFGLLILEGLLIRSVGLDSRYGTEVLGQGDLLRPWQDDEETPTLRPSAHFQILSPLRIALLDLEFAQRAARWPQVSGELVGRALQRARQLAINMAIVHHPRIDDRLHMLLWHLASRWGKVGPQGVSLELPLTHNLLATLVASRRPTVTTALGSLSRQGVVLSRPGGWLLTGDPPALPGDDAAAPASMARANIG